jgi:hypothetical protein
MPNSKLEQKYTKFEKVRKKLYQIWNLEPKNYQARYLNENYTKLEISSIFLSNTPPGNANTVTNNSS